jgi:hypothetical protein
MPENISNAGQCYVRVIADDRTNQHFLGAGPENAEFASTVDDRVVGGTSEIIGAPPYMFTRLVLARLSHPDGRNGIGANHSSFGRASALHATRAELVRSPL